MSTKCEITIQIAMKYEITITWIQCEIFLQRKTLAWKIVLLIPDIMFPGFQPFYTFINQSCLVCEFKIDLIEI